MILKMTFFFGKYNRSPDFWDTGSRCYILYERPNIHHECSHMTRDRAVDTIERETFELIPMRLSRQPQSDPEHTSLNFRSHHGACDRTRRIARTVSKYSNRLTRLHYAADKISKVRGIREKVCSQL